MVQKFYPKANPISELIPVIEKELSLNDLNTRNTLWATSLCSDELNQSISVISDYFHTIGPFVMGGISGIPFTGRTGFNAFASHIPDDGGAFILYGPHIGITNGGSLGQVQREGQADATTCCGSLMAGLNNAQAGNGLSISHNDYQQGQVNKMLIEKHDMIKDSDEPVKTVTDIAYEQIKRELSDIILACKENLGNKKLVTIGGILINTDHGQEDYFAVRDIDTY